MPPRSGVFLGMHLELLPLRRPATHWPAAALVATHVALAPPVLLRIGVAAGSLHDQPAAQLWVTLLTAACSITFLHLTRKSASVLRCVMLGSMLGWLHAVISMLGIAAAEAGAWREVVGAVLLTGFYGLFYAAPVGFGAGLVAALPLGLAARWRQARYVDGTARIHAVAGLSALLAGASALYVGGSGWVSACGLLAHVVGLAVLARGVAIRASQRAFVRRLAAGAHPDVRIRLLRGDEGALPFLLPSHRRATHVVLVPGLGGGSPYRSEPGWQPVAQLAL